MRLLFLKVGALAVGLSIVALWAGTNSPPASAQGMAPAQPPMQCTEAWLRLAMNGLGSAAGNMQYTGNVDKDAISALMIVERFQSQAAAWGLKCGKDAKMKAQATSMKTQADQNLEALAATTQSLP